MVDYSFVFVKRYIGNVCIYDGLNQVKNFTSKILPDFFYKTDERFTNIYFTFYFEQFKVFVVVTSWLRITFLTSIIVNY